MTLTDRRVAIPAGRLVPWLAGFTARHGTPHVTSADDDTVQLTAVDGAVAVLQIPLPPLTVPRPAGLLAGPELLDALVTHVAADRRVGALLVRKGGYAVGVFDGPQLLASKTGSAYVQGRTKAGGWSQQRYARRRDNQSRKAYADAADAAARVLLPQADTLVAVVLGGDRPAVHAVLADPRLAALADLVIDRVHPVPDPRLRVLQAFPEKFLAVEIGLNALA